MINVQQPTAISLRSQRRQINKCRASDHTRWRSLVNSRGPSRVGEQRQGKVRIAGRVGAGARRWWITFARRLTAPD